jgi:hypothetical protein
MSQSEPDQDVILGRGEGGKYLAWHLEKNKASGAEPVMGTGRFAAPRTLEVLLNHGGTLNGADHESGWPR